MKNMFKKLTAVILCGMIAFSLSACGEKKTDANPAETPAAETAAETSAPAAASARVTVSGTKFTAGGKELWINGVNTPWHHWNDFTGVMDEQFWDDAFAQLAADNINCTRIWVNCAGEAIVRLKTTGEIKEINEAHWTDLDKLFAIAEKHKVYVMATLLSFDHFKESNGGSQKWRALLQSKELCDAYADTYVKEFCKRYGDNEYLFSIDIMNEPDWVKENEECGKIDFDCLSYLFGKCAQVIHENSSVLVTVGMGMVKYNSDNWEGNMVSDAFLKEITGSDKAYLDFYSPHYYSYMKTFFGVPFDMSPAEWGMDDSKPCLFGETNNDDADKLGMTLTEKYKRSYENGWQGVMVWMDPEFDGDTCTWHEYGLTREATNAMAQLIPEKVHPLGN